MAKTKIKKKKKPTTISEMTGSRGYMPPPQRADVVKKGKNDRKSVRQKLKRGDYDV
jgi:hypothetical protein